MDLDLTIADLGLVPPPARGKRAAANLVHSYERDITAEDITFLWNAPPIGSQAEAIQKLRQSHHTLAQLLAAGTSQVEASFITGYTQPRISVLLKDPAFCELVEHYATIKKEIYLNVHERLAALGMDALTELQDRLNDPEAESFSNKELMDLVQLTMPKAGYGDRNTQVHEHTLPIDTLLEAVKAEVRSRTNGSIKTLDARPAQSGTSSDLEVGLGLTVIDQAPEHSEVPASGTEGGG
jgi:hypothetical protein